VLLSSHILPEVEMTCNRVLIMCEGRILAADTPENLQKALGQNGHLIAEIAAPLEELKTCWEQMPELAHYTLSAAEGEYHRCALTPSGSEDLRPKIFALVLERGWKLRELSRVRHSLEEVYIRLTLPESEEETF
jgi:ABC-2 type transport system ATP-binding protein